MIVNSAPHLNDKPTDVYRCFDQTGGLVYIGATHDLGVRLKHHRLTSPWWVDVASVEAETFPDRVSALEAEMAAIDAEQPRENKRMVRAILPPVTRSVAS